MPRFALAPPPPRSSYPDTAVFIAICAGFLALSAVRALMQPAMKLFSRLDAAERRPSREATSP